MVNKKVSVIIPCFNNEKTIERCILSALNQSYENIEIICINDGSSDKSWSILKEIALAHDNVSIFDNKENSGPSYSRNKGVSLSIGEFISFLDADDHWHKNKIEIQIKFIEKYNLDFIGSTCTVGVNKAEKIKEDDFKLKLITFNMMLFKNYFQTPSVVMKKKVFIQFNECQRFSEDYMSWMMIAYKKNNKCGLIYGRDLVFLDKFNFGISGLSSNLWLMEKWEMKNIYHFLSIGELMALPAMIVSFVKYIKRYILIRIIKIRGFC